MIEIGQGWSAAWAWMIFNEDRKLLASGENCVDRRMAIDVAIAVYQGIRKNDPGALPEAPGVIFPDEA